MIETYYTPAQQARLARRRNELGEEHIRPAERDWAEVIHQVKFEQSAGANPRDRRVLELGRRWRWPIEQVTGGDQGDPPVARDHVPRAGARVRLGESSTLRLCSTSPERSTRWTAPADVRAARRASRPAALPFITTANLIRSHVVAPAARRVESDGPAGTCFRLGG